MKKTVLSIVIAIAHMGQASAENLWDTDAYRDELTYLKCTMEDPREAPKYFAFGDDPFGVFEVDLAGDHTWLCYSPSDNAPNAGRTGFCGDVGDEIVANHVFTYQDKSGKRQPLLRTVFAINRYTGGLEYRIIDHLKDNDPPWTYGKCEPTQKPNLRRKF